MCVRGVVFVNVEEIGKLVCVGLVISELKMVKSFMWLHRRVLVYVLS